MAAQRPIGQVWKSEASQSSFREGARLALSLDCTSDHRA